MSRISLLNREPNIRPDMCQRISGKGVICSGISKETVARIITPFEELKKGEKSISNIDDLQLANQKVREREITKTRVLKKEENGGYILVGSLTCLGTLAIGTLIFMAIKVLIIG